MSLKTPSTIPTTTSSQQENQDTNGYVFYDNLLLKCVILCKKCEVKKLQKQRKGKNAEFSGKGTNMSKSHYCGMLEV